MKEILTLLILLITAPAFAHEGESHGAEKKAVPAAGTYFSSEALSDKYEVLIKYGELKGGQPATLLLFLSDARTNRALDASSIALTLAGQPATNFSAVRTDTGTYRVSGVFPANQIYDIQVQVNSALGPDLLQVARIEAGKTLTAPGTDSHTHWYDHPWLFGIAGALAGLALMYLLMRRRARKSVVVMLTLALLVPVAGMNPGYAHGGEDHGAGGAAKTSGSSTTFRVEKETQFLFDLLTQKTEPGNFYQSKELLGTVRAAPQGRAVIQTPQTGKIVALRVQPGQRVNKGQLLATVEQQVEAGTQLDIIAQRNTLNAEVKAAKAQYERLQSIADIAAKKDLTEARARYEAAQQNLRLFNANIGSGMGNTRMMPLTAPISGVVGMFNYAIGAVVNSGETLFEITNLDRLYVETQLFSQDLQDALKSSRFQVFTGNDTSAHALRLVTSAQAVNTENQAQQVVFEILRPDGHFRIGENVRVQQLGGGRMTQLVVPAASVVDINGKPAVFIKDKAEQFSLSFIRKGESNPLYTAIVSGVESGERVVTANVYKMKMIYLGQ